MSVGPTKVRNTDFEDFPSKRKVSKLIECRTRGSNKQYFDDRIVAPLWKRRGEGLGMETLGTTRGGTGTGPYLPDSEDEKGFERSEDPSPLFWTLNLTFRGPGRPDLREEKRNRSTLP